MDTAIDRAIAFVDSLDYELGSALLRHVAYGESGERVLAAVASYQNEDGGIGNGLEVDIASPVSNPWATRLAIIALRWLNDTSSSLVHDGIREWLTATQWDDGDWRLPELARQDRLAPWFAAWEHPSLNPSCCLVGLGESLGLIEPAVRERTAALFRVNASIAEVAKADFYALLPYVEYLNSPMMPERDAYLAAVADAIVTCHRNGGYPDAQHVLEHALGGGPDLIDRLPRQLINQQFDALRSAQRADGGWPVEYGAAWEPWVATCNALALAGQAA